MAVTDWRALAAAPLLEFDGEMWTHGDAVLVGLVEGTWSALETRTRRGLALAAAVAQGALVPADPDAVQGVVVAFRRGRRLLAAEDLRLFLEDVGVDGDAVLDCAERQVLRDREGAGVADLLPRPAPGAVAAVLHAEAVVDGTLLACAETVLQRAAALHAVGAPPPVPSVLHEALLRAVHAGPDKGLLADGDRGLADRASRVLASGAALRAYSGDAASPERVRRLLRRRRLELTRVSFDDLGLSSEHAAREAVLCARVDGVGLGQVAARAHVEVVVDEQELADLPAGLRAGIAAARPGDVIGPLREGDAWRVVAVRDRVPPTLEDPAVARRLSDELVTTALMRHAAGRVTWHVRL